MEGEGEGEGEEDEEEEVMDSRQAPPPRPTGEVLKVLYTNAQSVVSKVDELSSVASDMDPDLILLTKSWCSDQITNAYLTFPGYELITDLRKDRYDTDRGRGGGLLVYAKNNLNVSILPSDDSDDKFQYCKFKVSDVI
jgi:hypothetical protein